MFRVPRVGPALLVLAVGGACGGSSSTGPHYSGPPLTVSFSPSQVSQGDQATITIGLPTNALSGGIPLILTFSGVGVGVDSATVPPDSGGSPLQATLTVPGASPDGALHLTVSLPTLGDTASAVLTIKDVVPPTVNAGGISSGLSGFHNYGNLLIAGTTDSIVVTASDNHLLAWLGWSLSGPATLGDSVQASAATDSVMIPIAVPASLAGDSLTLTAFAIDADGNQATTSLPAIVSAVTSHPVASVPRGGRIADVAFDSARGLLYLAKPDSQRVAVISLATMTYQTPIAVTGMPNAVDLTPSGDSLIVGLASPASLTIVDLTSAAHSVLGTLSFDAGGVVDSLMSMRVMADHHAVAVVAHPGGNGHGVVMSLDLGTGTSQALDSSGISTSSILECSSHIVRSGDRTRAMAMNCGGWGQVAVVSPLYSSVTHADSYAPYWGCYVSPIIYDLCSNNVFTSASASGRILYQIGHAVMDSTVTPIVTGPNVAYGAAIAPNATDFYVSEGLSDSTSGLFLHYALPRQLPTEIAIIPHPAYELAVSPDASRLIGITADTIMGIDLTHSTPASPAQVARLRRLLRTRTLKTRVAALAKPDAFTVRLRGKTLLPIAINRASRAP